MLCRRSSADGLDCANLRMRDPVFRVAWSPIMAEESFAEILERSTLRCREADAPLAERLQLFADDVRSLSPLFAEIVDRMVARLKTSGAGLASPSPGEPMPSFLLPNQDGELISLEQLLA